MAVSREEKWYITHNSKSDLPLVVSNNHDLISSTEALEEKRKRIEQAKYEAGMKCRIEIQDDTIVEVNEDAQLHFVKFETRQIEKCLDYIRDTLMMSEHFTQVPLTKIIITSICM